MKKRAIFTELSLAFMMVVFMAFAGCQKDAATSPTLGDSGGKSATLALHGGILSVSGGCNCEYQIISATTSSLPPTGKHFEYQAITQENCDNSLNCHLFEFLESDCPEIFFPVDGCYDLESAGVSKPTGWYPFNCEVDLYSVLNLDLYSPMWVTTNCIPDVSNFPSGTVQIKLRCTDPSPPYCGSGYTFVSKVFDVIFSGGTATPVTVRLTGCGCQLPT